MSSISIVVLSIIFFCALICLIIICLRYRNIRNKRQTLTCDRFDNGNANISRRINIVRKGFKKAYSEPELTMALNDIGLGSALEQILNDEKWFDDASGLIPHCLAVLRTCHRLTERLANFAMRPLGIKCGSTQRLIESAKRVPFRVDDVVQSMYPPMDGRLLEARVTALVLSVGQLALLAQSISTMSERQHLVWIDQGLQNMDDNLMILRKAAIEIDDPNRIHGYCHNSNV